MIFFVLATLILGPFLFYGFIALAQKFSSGWQGDIPLWLLFAFPITVINYFVSQAWRMGLRDLGWPHWIIALLAMSLGCLGTTLGMTIWFKQYPSWNTLVGFLFIFLGMAITIVWK